MSNIEITEDMRARVRAAVGDHLSKGLGTPESHCVMAAVSLAIDGQLSDRPTCVHAADRAFAIGINDARWSSDQARAEGMLPLALAAMGTAGTDRTAWVRAVAEGTIRRVVPMALLAAASRATPEAAAALEAAAARGVSVNLILESAENLDGGGGAHAYAKYRTYQWPADRREPPDAKLHAKAVIIDSRDVLLTSANMTNAAYDKNIELGVLCRGGAVARQVQAHFDALIARGVLKSL